MAEHFEVSKVGCQRRDLMGHVSDEEIERGKMNTKLTFSEEMKV
jgi:hypothetical protein